jgi:hypothetical protein
MSSLWTPSGERRVSREAEGPGPGAPPPAGGEPPAGADDPAVELDALRRELAQAPAETVVANHCYGLFELAAVYLSEAPPRMDQARLAIDALGYLVDGLGPRLGDAATALRDALAQIRVAYVRLEAAQREGDGAATG